MISKEFLRGVSNSVTDFSRLSTQPDDNMFYQANVEKNYV